MTKLEKEVLLKVLEQVKVPHVRGRAYDEHFRVVDEGEDHKLLDDPAYQKAWEQCHADIAFRLNALFLDPTATAADLKRYLGRKVKGKK